LLLLEVPAVLGRTEPWRPVPALGGMLFSLLALTGLMLPLLPGRLRRQATVGLRRLDGGLSWALLAAMGFTAFSVCNGLLSAGARLPTSFPERYPLADQPLGWLVLPLGACVAGPLIEEFCFRGQLLPRLARIWGRPIALAGTSALFALAHGSGALLPFYFAGGLLLGYARLATGSIWAPVLAHALANWWAFGTAQGWVHVPVDVTAPVVLALAAVCALATALLLGQAQRAGRRGRLRRAAARRARGAGGPVAAEAVAADAYVISP